MLSLRQWKTSQCPIESTDGYKLIEPHDGVAVVNQNALSLSSSLAGLRSRNCIPNMRSYKRTLFRAFTIMGDLAWSFTSDEGKEKTTVRKLRPDGRRSEQFANSQSYLLDRDSTKPEGHRIRHATAPISVPIARGGGRHRPQFGPTSTAVGWTNRCSLAGRLAAGSAGDRCSCEIKSTTPPFC